MKSVLKLKSIEIIKISVVPFKSILRIHLACVFLSFSGFISTGEIKKQSSPIEKKNGGWAHWNGSFVLVHSFIYFKFKSNSHSIYLFSVRLVCVRQTKRIFKINYEWKMHANTADVFASHQIHSFYS